MLAGRFAADLDALIAPAARIGLAVSGGPDSLALLLLAAEARPGKVEAASVDHALRPGSKDEAQMVADVCKGLGVPHRVLTAEWRHKPETGIQERARIKRYRLLSQWLIDRNLSALVTAHHLDDQAETLLMRLNRGSGVRGLAGMRRVSVIPGRSQPLLRPLLGWRRSELAQVCESAGLAPADDPSNSDEKFERIRVRQALDSADWIDREAMARSAAHLAGADDALKWATDREWKRRVSESEEEIVYRPRAPAEIRRRVVRRVLAELAIEGRSNPVRGREVDQLIGVLSEGGKATLRGVLCSGGDEWRFSRAPSRRRRG